MLHVAAKSDSGDTPTSEGSDPEAELEQAVDAARSRSDDAPTLGIRTMLRQGDPAQEIDRAAREEDVGLIVVGTHGRGGFRQADRPILLVPSPKD